MMYGSSEVNGEQEEPITMKSDHRAQILWMQKLYQNTMLLLASKPLTREQVDGAPAFAFTESLLKHIDKQRT